MTDRILVVGLGNPDRGDDGVGPAVVAQLQARVPDSVRLTTRAGDLLTMLGEWSGLDVLVCIDAAASMGMPGRVHRFDVSSEPLPRDLSAPASSHALGLADTLAMGRVLDLLPPTVIVFAIEGETFETGASLSDVAASAVGEAVAMVAAELHRLARLERADA